MDYQLRPAVPEDRDWIYACKAASVRPYVESIWGWDEAFQRRDFDGDFGSIGQFRVIEAAGQPIGFLQVLEVEDCVEVAELHLAPDRRGQGCGERLLRALAAELSQAGVACVRSCVSKKNRPSLALHQKVGFTVERDPGWDFGTGEEDAGSFGMLRRIP